MNNLTNQTTKSFGELSTGEKIGAAVATAAIIPALALWGTFKGAQAIYRKGKETYDKYQKTKSLAEQMKNLELRPIKDEEIRAAFDEAVASAKNELDITAMNLNYMAERYTSQFRTLLERGVTIKIFYGIGEEDAPKKENLTTNKTAATFKSEFFNYPNFKMKRADTHAKVFICDNKFLVLSSYNLLTKDGKIYDWGEAGLLTNAPSVIAGFRQDYFSF